MSNADERVCRCGIKFIPKRATHRYCSRECQVRYLSRADDGSMANFLLRLPAGLHQRLWDAASERDLSMSHLARRAVEEYLDRLIPAEQLRLTTDQLLSSTADGTPGAVVEGASAGTSSRDVSDGQVAAAGAPVPAATTAEQASVS